MINKDYNSFENWLNANQIITARQYVGYMRTIERELGVKDFKSIKVTSLLEKWWIEIQSKPSFSSRGESDRSNLLSGFKKYIEFIKATNPKTSKR